ncbi:MAG: hypothetical protein LPL00_09990 [Alphaproteobacteria bacterium]|nr:hypothetical protein [Alphaproteobacteria bacterium]MDX5370001.1 hypothetical protein [Alphaproteobacteria bacterium]MDX5464579.1 hypothetical protein [Alphaproteobacteria bacterium]
MQDLKAFVLGVVLSAVAGVIGYQLLSAPYEQPIPDPAQLAETRARIAAEVRAEAEARAAAEAEAKRKAEEEARAAAEASAAAARARAANPMGAPRTGFNPLMPGGGASAQPTTSKSGVPLNEEFGNLPDAPGMEETFYTCTACHSTAIIKQQHVTDARWDDLWQWMINTQGMPETDEETKKIVLDYLKTHFSSER